MWIFLKDGRAFMGWRTCFSAKDGSTMIVWRFRWQLLSILSKRFLDPPVPTRALHHLPECKGSLDLQVMIALVH
jgi:hypothetical protein